MNGICSVCGIEPGDTAPTWLLSDRRKDLEGSWRLVECENCGVISMMPLPSDSQLKSYYSAYSRDQTVDLLPGRGSRYPALRKFFHWFSGDVDPRDFLEIPGSARVLDYGCGLAGYLVDFHNRGVSISGAEITGHVVETCQRAGFDVRKVDDLSHIPFPDAEFDIVYLMQVFEHLRDPHGFMKELNRVLKPGGSLYLAVPNVSSFWRRIFRHSWVSGWHAPFHLFHYNRQTLGSLAESHGLRVADSWSRTPESWFRLNLKAVLFRHQNRLDWRNTWLDNRLVRGCLMIFLRLVEFPVAERDCLTMKLEKQG